MRGTRRSGTFRGASVALPPAIHPPPHRPPVSEKTTAFVSHHDCPRHDTGWGHVDHQGRLPAIVRAVYKDMLTLFDPLLEVEAVPATEDDLRLVHTAEHVQRVRETAERALAEGAILEVDGVPVSGATWEAALAAAGAGITAADAVLRGDARNAFCLVRPHGRGARPDAAGELGFFNNVAITTRHLRQREGLERVLVVDLGIRPPATAEIVGAEEGVTFLSIHQHPGSFPTPEPTEPPPAGVVPERWIALAPGSGGAEVEAALRNALATIPAAESPDIVLLGLGLHVLAGDPLGQLAVQPDEVYAITALLRAWADEHAAGRLVSILEGGYVREGLGRASVQHLRALAGLPRLPAGE
ncbi:MAG: Histone deacetylase superfamily [Gemmatimonadetes bacterium]|nr:Histone deacetylase superfamily [Gemmatimonadota bacterium]